MLKAFFAALIDWIASKFGIWFKKRAQKQKDDSKIDKTTKKVEGAINEQKTDAALDSVVDDFYD